VIPGDQQGEYRVEPLAAQHDRTVFLSGVAAIDTYLRRQAGQDSDRNLAAVYVLTPDSRTVAGFYTLSSYSIASADLPEETARKLPSMSLPATLLGRMGIAQAVQGERLGKFLLMHALWRAYLSSEGVAAWAVLVDAKIGARQFYLKHGFTPLPKQPDRLFLPMKAIAKLFA
jgi:GNAT superfamily N-acetyltransferase